MCMAVFYSRSMIVGSRRCSQRGSCPTESPELWTAPSPSDRLESMAETTLESCDVLVIGGGPGGSTAAALLAERGHRVVVLEKARHPRFHIGESLLPANLPLFDELGVGDAMREIGMHKPGAEFVSPWHAHKQTFYFSDAWDKSLPSAYQVRRSAFDEILFRRAAAVGATARDGCRVTDLRFLP